MSEDRRTCIVHSHKVKLRPCQSRGLSVLDCVSYIITGKEPGFNF